MRKVFRAVKRRDMKRKVSLCISFDSQPIRLKNFSIMAVASSDVNCQPDIMTVLIWEDNCSFSSYFKLDEVSVE